MTRWTRRGLSLLGHRRNDEISDEAREEPIGKENVRKFQEDMTHTHQSSCRNEDGRKWLGGRAWKTQVDMGGQCQKRHGSLEE